ncbi:MAG: ABC transporter permease [Chloroflexi bacterium]|nr:ABC transporter permease [Chloroflexota bacterium]
MIEGILTDLAAVMTWFGDPVNWTGRDGIPNRLTEHIVMCLLSMVGALVVAVPIGLYIGHTGRFATVTVNIVNIGRAVPSYALMAVLYPLSIAFVVMGPGADIAFLATFLAMVLLAIPPIVTNTWAGIRGVDDDLREAARGMGMRGHEVLRGLEIPLALPVLLVGVRIATVQVIATATLGAVFGGGGLGRYIVQGFARQDDARLWAGAIMVAALAILAEVGFGWWIRRVDRHAIVTRR